MTLHKNVNLLRTLKTPLVLTLAVAVSALATQTFAATSTADYKLRSTASEMKAATQQNLNEEQKQTQLQEKQLAATGEAGSGMSLVNSPGFAGLGSQSEFYSNMEKFGFDMCAVNLCQVGDNPTDTTDIEEARDWAHKTFFSSVNLNDSETDDLLEVRRRAAAYTAANAFAISTIIHNDLAAGGGSAQALEEIVDSATDFRKDVQANSVIALASYKVAIQQLAVLSAILDVQASQALTEAGLYHEDGGTEFPNAHISEDFGVDGTRRKVTMPEKGSSN